jgi:hypothetical protein
MSRHHPRRVKAARIVKADGETAICSPLRPMIMFAGCR